MIHHAIRRSLLAGLLVLALTPAAARADDATKDEKTNAHVDWAATRVGMGQVWTAELIPELRKHGFNGSLVQTYATMTPASLRQYLATAKQHGFDVMPTVRPAYLKNGGRDLRALAAVAAGYDNVWGWHCEGLTDEQVAAARDILGIENIIHYDNNPKPDPARAIRYSRLWYPYLRASADNKETPNFGRARPELLSTYPLYQIDARVRPPLTWDIWIQACGRDAPETGPRTFRSFYVPPTEEVALYQVLMASRAGAKAVWWYSLAVKTGPSDLQPLWKAQPDVWKAVTTATDFLLNGEAPHVRSTDRYLRYETPQESKSP